MSFRSFFLSPASARDEANRAHLSFATGKSDLLTHLQAFNKWLEIRKQGRSAEAEFCTANFLSRHTLYQVQELRKQYRDILEDLGFSCKSGSGDFEKVDVDADEVFEYIEKHHLHNKAVQRVAEVWASSSL